MNSYSFITLLFFIGSSGVFAHLNKQLNRHDDLSFNLINPAFGLKESDDCPCGNEYLCLPIEIALRRNSSLPHVIEYVKKKDKPEVSQFFIWGLLILFKFIMS